MGSGELPEGWVCAEIGDVTERAEKIDPRNTPDRIIRYIDISSIDNKRFRIAGPSIVKLSEAPSRARQLIREGDTLFSLVRPYLKNIAFVDASLDGEIASTGFCVLRSNGALDPKFLFYRAISQDFVNSLSEGQYGVSYPAVNEQQVRAQLIAVAPLNEQRRIVEKIEALFAELDKGEESLRQVQKLLARYRQSVLKAAVTGELTADWRARHAGKLEHGRDFLARILKARRENWQGRGEYKDPVRPHADRLPELPQGWVWTTVDQLLVHLTSGSRDWKRFYGRGNGVFIMAQNVRPMRFDLSERFLVDPPRGSPDAVRSEVKKDDLLVTIVGANTGDVCRFPLDAREHYVCQSVALIRLADARFSRYLELYLSSHGGGREQIDAFIYGAGRPHLSFEQLRSICVPLPPFEEQAEIQRRVAEVVDQIDKIQQACTLEFARSSALRNSILKFAFSGRLVPQDPNDEPASELLARIRAQRASESRKTTRRAATA